MSFERIVVFEWSKIQWNFHIIGKRKGLEAIISLVQVAKKSTSMEDATNSTN